ncbi:MAG TPA: hypothetical protein VKT78_18005 [Fimbriimonadaceae bacterium]|nr:hypothetical protein [Fimbriimonadaceae bacterium]
MLLKRTILLALAAASSAAYADSLTFNNFDTNFGYDTTHVDTLNKSYNFGTAEGYAMEFVAATSGTLSGLDLAMFYASGPVTLSFFSEVDNGSVDTVGNSLESWTVSGQGSEPYSFSGDGSVSVVAGQKYWVGLYTTSTTSIASWAGASVPASVGTELIPVSAYVNGAWTDPTAPVYAAFDVRVGPPAPTPEPLTMGLGLAGLGIAALRRLRRS